MNSNLDVLSLDEEKINFVLTNYKYFSRDEVTLAAKLKVMNDKKQEFNARRTLQENSELCKYNRAMTISRNRSLDMRNYMQWQAAARQGQASIF